MNKKRYSLLNLLYRTEKDIFRIAPIGAILMVMSLIIQSLIVGFHTYYLAEMFTNAQLYLYGSDVKNLVIFDGCLLVAFYALRQLTAALFTGAMVRVDSKVMYSLNIELSKKCTRLPLIYFEDADKVNELTRAKNCLQWTKLTDLSLSFYNIFSEIILVISVITVLAKFNIWLIPISFISVLPFIIIRVIRGNQFYELKWFQVKKERRKKYLFGLFNNKLSMKEIRVMGTGDYLQDKWKEVRDEINEEIWSFKRKDLFSLMFCDILKIGGYLLSVAFIIKLTIDGSMNIGMMSASMVSFLNFQNSMKYFLINLGRIPECASFTSDFYYFMDLEEEKCGEIEVNPTNNGIHLKNVSFSYPNVTNNTLKNINLDINDGETVVILGENGSGKSTLTKVILGLFKCVNGQVSYGNIDIQDINKDYLYNYVSMVAQTFAKYNLSLRENIALGNIEKMGCDEEIKKILELLKLDNVVDSEKGLDTLLGKEFGGKELSQGQWQKVAIGRTLFKDSNIVFLDEPTSALDPVIETEILSEFLNIVNGKTAVIISHRVGLCKDVDKIIVMRDGEISEIGNHSELMLKKGEYYRLYTAQSKWYS